MMAASLLSNTVWVSIMIASISCVGEWIYHHPHLPDTQHYYPTVQYNTIQYSTVQYYTVQYNTMQYILPYFWLALTSFISCNISKPTLLDFYLLCFFSEFASKDTGTLC